ncbi:hypothetical protein AADZ86_18290 [Colwelliaceae bacterium BS250]
MFKIHLIELNHCYPDRLFLLFSMPAMIDRAVLFSDILIVQRPLLVHIHGAG